MPSTPEKKEMVKAYSAWGAVCLFWGTTYLAIGSIVGYGSFIYALSKLPASEVIPRRIILYDVP